MIIEPDENAWTDRIKDTYNTNLDNSSANDWFWTLLRQNILKSIN